MNISTVKWYASRLAAMSWPERIHRVRESYLRRTAPLDVRVAITVPEQLLRLPSIDLLTRLASEQHCFAAPTKLHEPIVAYEQLWPLDSRGLPKWHVMLNGADSSAIPCFKVHYRNSSDLKDDVRINWELNRLTWLIPSAVCARKTQNESIEKYVIEVLESYLESDRVGYSSRWSSAIELAMQAMTLIIVSSILGETAISPDLQTRLSAAILTRYEWLERFPSKFSSANNHLLAELAALSVISGLIPSLASEHKKHVQEFSTECGRQFNDDGLNAELATDYHLYALDLMISVLYLSPQPMLSELRVLTEHVARTTKSIANFCGFWPRISDSDHAALLSNATAEPNRALWLATFCEELMSIRLECSDDAVLSLASSGYSFIKSENQAQELLLLVDHGYFGFGDIAGHGHADSAAIWMWVNQEPVLVESGTYSYHSRSDLRDALRSSMMHNTISINGASTSTPDGPFLWLRSKRAAARLASIDGKHVEIEVDIPKSPAVPSGATHWRTLELSGLRLKVTERVQAQDSFELASHLIVDQGYAVSESSSAGQVALVSATGQSIVVTYDPMTIRHEIDSVETSPSYGKLEKSTRISLINVHQDGAQSLCYVFEMLDLTT
jgi:Heparinase II/III-like protein/Heparinase II/III N-terminus